MPDDTPILAIPYPLGDDALTDYPATGQALAERLEDLLVAPLYDSGAIAAAVASIDITSIPGGYAHLLLELYLRSARTGATMDTLDLRFNGDTGNNYDHGSERHGPQSGSLGFASGYGVAIARLGSIPAANAPANSFGAGSIRIPHYAGATNHKLARHEGSLLEATGGDGAAHVLGRARWRNVAAINRVTLFATNGNLVAGSRVVLYGIPGG